MLNDAELTYSSDRCDGQDGVAHRRKALAERPQRAPRFTDRVHPFDWEDAATWPAALDDVSAAYVSYFPDIAFPGAVEKVEELCQAAKDAGVGRIVLLSGRGEHHARLAEEVVRTSGLGFTLVRAAWFAQNFSEGYLRDPVLSGVVAMPGGDVREPIIDVDDIADVAVGALTDEAHSGQLYEVTGPRLMSFAEMANELGTATGRPIQYVPIRSRISTPPWSISGVNLLRMSSHRLRATPWTAVTPICPTAFREPFAASRETLPTSPDRRS